MSKADFDRHSTNPSAGDPLVPIPPPPPPRSTPPPVRPVRIEIGRANSIPPLTGPAVSGSSLRGVGSAGGIRWRGELDDLSKTMANGPHRTADSTDQDNNRPVNPDRMTREAPPWLVSLVVHLILLLALALISSPAGSSIGKVMLSIGQSEVETPVELVEFSVAEVPVNDDGELLEQSEPETVSVFEMAQLSEVESIAPVEVGVGIEVAYDKPMFDGRTGAMKEALLAIYGGTAETQEAVKLGLEWLKRYQTRKGNWSLMGSYDDGGLSENEIAATAMALLAFMGDGHTHQSGEYAKVVEDGMKFLVAKQDRQGFFNDNGRDRNSRMYAQAQATIAISELYGMTKDSWLRAKAQLAVNFAIHAQSPEGGWRYRPRDDSDTSVTGWYVMALKSAEAAGLEVDRYALINVDRYLNSVQSFDGAAYAYQRLRDPSPAMTAEGLLCRQYIGWNRDHPPLRLGIEALLLDSPFDVNNRDVYYWYYATQVMHHYGGDPWKRWNQVMRVELPKSQVTRGNQRGSWSPQSDQWGDAAGRLYTTCLSLYCLEVYYRHMPLYKPDSQ